VKSHLVLDPHAEIPMKSFLNSLRGGTENVAPKASATRSLRTIETTSPGHIVGDLTIAAPPLEAVQTPTSVVYTSYDPSTLPGKTPYSDARHWTRFVCISDTHAHTFDVPDGDVLLHSGDLTNTGRLNEMKITVDWIADMPHQLKLFVILTASTLLLAEQVLKYCRWKS
jgi:hypothetical protein